jgi:pimeloyl-ACP methyl ester carboxylesterase
MTGGAGVNKEPGTDLFAKRFNDAGFAVLAFDYRRLGESGGQPRQIIRMREQLADWQAAIGFASALPGVDPARLAIWGFSLSGGHVFRVAARNPGLAAAIAQTSLADGPAAARKAGRHQTPRAMLRFTGRGVLDAVGGFVGRPPLLVPLAGEPGTVAMLTTPDALDGDRALNPDNRYPEWQQAIAARSALRIILYRPGRSASRVRCPLLVLVCDQDQAALPGPAARAAKRAPSGELVRMPGGHYEPFLGGHEQAVEAELSFLRRHLLDRAPADQPAAAASVLHLGGRA